MTNNAAKVIGIADKITVMAEEGVSGLDRTIAKWPAEFRVIIWEAVAHIASLRAHEARKTQ